MSDPEAVVAELTERLRRFPEVRFAYLFGSRAGGRPRPDSDWDVAVYLDPVLAARRRFDLRLRLDAELADLGRIDVVPLNDAPALLAHRALQGRRLFVADASRHVGFFVRTLAASGDEAYFRDIHAAARRRRLEEGRFGRP